MALFGLIRDRAVTDPVLGELERSRGYWRGRLALGASRDVPLLMIGGREGPDSAALALARELPSRYPSLQGPIGVALFEHHLPYWQEMDAGEAEQKFRLEALPKSGRTQPRSTSSSIRSTPTSPSRSVTRLFGTSSTPSALASATGGSLS